MTEVTTEWSGTARGVHRAIEAAVAEGRLVSYVPVQANSRGVVVRVVLRDVEVGPSPQPTPTGARQERSRSAAEGEQKPSRSSTRRLAVVGVSVGVGASVGIGLCWAGKQAAVWVGNNWALLLGFAAVLTLVAGGLTWLLVGGRGGDSHPCNR